MKATRNFIAVDLGASNGRVLAGLWDGERFELQELHRFTNGAVSAAGHLFTNPLRLWTEVKAGLAAYAGRFKTEAAGLSVDTWGVDYALLDKAGQLLGNPYHYRDPRTNNVPQLAYERVPAAEVYAVTGIQTMQFNTIFQLYSMVMAADPQLDLADRMLMLPDLFGYWLTGEKLAEYTIASTSQMLDCRKRGWAPDLLERFGIPTRILPSIVPPGTVAGRLRPEVASEVGLDPAVQVIAGPSHDTAAAVAGIPGLDETSAYISSGTWSLVGMEVGDPIITPQALAMNFTNEGGVGNTVRFLRNIAGLWLLQESMRQWQAEGHPYGWEELMRLAEQSEPFRSFVDPDCPDFLAPGNMPGAIRSYCSRTGQPMPTGTGEVARACLEGMALRYRWAIETMEKLSGRRIETIRIVGGGCQNTLLNQFTADACNRAVVAGPVEAAALGTVMMQAVATGHLSDIRSGRQAIAASVVQHRYQPRNAPAWDPEYARFEKILDGTKS